jgi:hypothetical protein
MPLPWPSFWQHVREDDRAALSDILSDLLAHGAIIGDVGRNHELYLLTREYQREIGEYLAPLHLELVPDPDRPIFQLRPVPADCRLMARFNKAETLVVLTLWRIYHDARMENVSDLVIIPVNVLWQRLRLYFETIAPPNEGPLREMLVKLRHRRWVRVKWEDDPARFGDTQIEILPTLQRAIPFENAAAWEQQVAMYSAPSSTGTDIAALKEKEGEP